MLAHRTLPASPATPALARRIVGAIPELADLPDLRFAAQLLVSELTGNSVRHSGLRNGGSVSLSVSGDDETLRLEVADPGGGFDALRLLAEHGRNDERYHGIFLLNALADRWGFRRGKSGCVWFELDLVPGRRSWRGRESSSAHRLSAAGRTRK